MKRYREGKGVAAACGRGECVTWQWRAKSGGGKGSSRYEVRAVSSVGTPAGRGMEEES